MEGVILYNSGGREEIYTKPNGQTYEYGDVYGRIVSEE